MRRRNNFDEVAYRERDCMAHKGRIWYFGILLTLFLVGGKGAAYGQFQDQIDSLTRVLSIEADHREKVDILLQLTELTLADNPDLAINYANRAKTIAGNVEYVEGQARALGGLAAIYRTSLEFEAALEFLSEANDIFVSIDDKMGLAQNQLQIGLVYQAQGDFANARVSFQEVVGIAQEMNDKRLEAVCQVYIGTLYYDEGKREEARDYYLIALGMYRGYPDDRDFGPALSNLGEFFLQQENYPKASEYISTALRIYETTGEIQPMVRLNFMAGEIAYQSKRFPSALQHFRLSLDMAQVVNDQEYIIKSYELLSDTYAELGEFQSAYIYQGYYAAIKDSEKLTELEAKLEAERRKVEAEENKRLRDLAEADLAYTQRAVYGLITGIVLISLLMIFVVRQYRLKNQANIALQAAIEEAERSREEKQKFLAYTSHEIRTPLNAVVGMIELLKKTPLNEGQERYVNTIKSSSDNILIIVNDILDLTKIDSGKIDFEEIDFMLTELVDEIVYMLRVKAEAKGIQLKAIFDKELPVVITGDPLRLSQILLNLVNNAIKFTEQGEVTVRVNLLRETDKRARIGITVADTGIGIRKEKLSSVFNRFEQEDTDTTRKYGGAGLGLSITKQLVELQGGSISVRSKWGEGSTFSVRLQFDKSDQQTLINTDGSADVIPAEELGDFSLLLVDDNQLNRTILFDLLKDWNPRLKIEMAEDGKSAVRMVQGKDYDVVLMDIQMPRMNGYQASRFIRDQLPHPKSRVPIIAMTAHALSGISDKIHEAGMNDYISKPINTASLITKFAALLQSPRRRLETRTVPSPPKENEPTKIEFKTINLTHLRTLTKNDPQKILKYIDIFLRNLDQDLADFKQQVSAEDWQALGKVAHKMKGNSSYMGISELETIFASVQHYGELGVDADEVRIVTQRIDELCEAAVKELLTVKENL